MTLNILTREQHEQKLGTVFTNILYWICNCGVWPDTPSKNQPPPIQRSKAIGGINVFLRDYCGADDDVPVVQVLRCTQHNKLPLSAFEKAILSYPRTSD